MNAETDCGCDLRPRGGHGWLLLPAIALGYQCGFAYLVALCINQLGNLIAYGTFGLGQVVAILVVCIFIFLMVRPDKYRGTDVIRAKVNV